VSNFFLFSCSRHMSSTTSRTKTMPPVLLLFSPFFPPFSRDRRRPEPFSFFLSRRRVFGWSRTDFSFTSFFFLYIIVHLPPFPPRKKRKRRDCANFFPLFFFFRFLRRSLFFFFLFLSAEVGRGGMECRLFSPFFLPPVLR